MTMFATEPTMTADDLRDIATPTLVMAGDDDMIDLAHTCEMYDALPHAAARDRAGDDTRVAMEKPELVARLVLDFLASPAEPSTLMPVRRARRRSG